MPFIKEILKYNSLSIVGLEKNTGKTECLNYILNRLPHDKTVAVTSIGIDGERVDLVTKTPKPEIFIRDGVYFSTSQVHYKEKRILAEIVNITNESGALGRIITARALSSGKVLLSGPSSIFSLNRWMQEMNEFNVDLKIVDGALSRLSLASPVVCESMVLATGAALSVSMDILISKTKFITKLIDIEQLDGDICSQLLDIESGVWGIDESDGAVVDLKIPSSLLLNKIDKDFTKNCKYIYVSGALTERFLRMISDSANVKGLVLIIRDFTKIFVDELSFNSFIRRGGEFKVLGKSKLIAVCVNPFSPNGYVLNSNVLCEKLSQAIQMPVYDIVKNKYDF